MENVCIRVRFSPLMKNISKNNSKCRLEIVPLVTCIENIDKIKWKHEKDKIEYIVPMNYKIVIKKLKPNDDALKMYYSCVDLLPFSLSNVDIDTAIYRVISDNIVLNKEKTDLKALTNMPPHDIKLNKTIDRKSINPIHPNESPLSIDLSDSLLKLINMTENLKSLNRPVQTKKDEAENRPSQQRVKDTHVDTSTTTVFQNNQILIKTANRQKCTKNYQKRKLYNVSFCKNIQPIHAKDYFMLDNLKTDKGISSIAGFKYYNNMKTRINKTLQSSPHHIIYDSFDEDMIISNIRIKPEVRVAKFVEKMEKEIMPLRIILDNIILKCSSLGLQKNVSSNEHSLDANIILRSNKTKKRGVQMKKSYNRVVYSIVFDE